MVSVSDHSTGGLTLGMQPDWTILYNDPVCRRGSACRAGRARRRAATFLWQHQNSTTHFCYCRTHSCAVRMQTGACLAWMFQLLTPVAPGWANQTHGWRPEVLARAKSSTSKAAVRICCESELGSHTTIKVFVVSV